VLALALLPTEFTASQFQRRASHRVAAEIALTDKTAAAVEAIRARFSFFGTRGLASPLEPNAALWYWG
jgi:hypothetical protein